MSEQPFPRHKVTITIETNDPGVLITNLTALAHQVKEKNEFPFCSTKTSGTDYLTVFTETVPEVPAK